MLNISSATINPTMSNRNAFSPVHLLTFGAGNRSIRSAVNRLGREARRTDSFTSIFTYTDSSLYREYPDLRLEIESLSRRFVKGYGLFIWKILLIQKILNKIPENSVLLYLDAGCTLNLANPAAQERFHKYLEFLEKQEILAFQLKDGQFHDSTSFCELNWSMGGLMNHLELTEKERHSNQIESGVIFFRNNQISREFVSFWLSLARKNDYEYIRESAIMEGNQQIGQNRHDQSVFSCLYKKFGYLPLSNETYFKNSWETNGSEFPIWATRNRTGISHEFRILDVPERIEVLITRLAKGVISRVRSRLLPKN